MANEGFRDTDRDEASPLSDWIALVHPFAPAMVRNGHWRVRGNYVAKHRDRHSSGF